MPSDAWQDALIEELRALLEPDPDVRALVVFGSWASPETRDRFSDVDMLLVTADGRLARFFPPVEWLAPIGNAFAIERSVRERHGALRVVFDDMRRLDVVVVEEQTVATNERWSGHPFRTPRFSVFSRSDAVDHAVASIYEPVPPKQLSATEFQARVDAFWFVAQLAVHKAVRGDLLFAAQLSLQLQRDRAGGARHPRGAATDGGILARLTPSARRHTATGIIDVVQQTASLFDELAAAWEPGYRPKLPLLQPEIDVARRAV
jgi:predicted nucleotidyltransferase